MRKGVFVAHCLLNQYARAKGVTNTFKKNGRVWGTFKPLVEELLQSGVAIIQLPCPEIIWEGLQRKAAGLKRYDNKEYRAVCKKIAAQMFRLYEEYRKDGVEIVGFIGVNGSPSCGVEMTCGFKSRPGIFTEEFLQYFRERRVNLLSAGVRIYNLAESLKNVRRMLK